MQFLPLTQRSQATLRTQEKTPCRKEAGRARLCTPIIPALERQRWEDQEFRTILAAERVQS